jgi:toxin-antitoxin system PIN domain toxin
LNASLLDVNVLVALFDPAHPSHNDAHTWFEVNRQRPWATCPITVNGVVRILSSPAYTSVDATAADVISRLQDLCSTAHHEFWPDEISLLNGRIFRAALIAGHQKITDVYLLGLAVHRGGRLVTFDRSIPLQPVVGAEPRHLKLLGPKRA